MKSFKEERELAPVEELTKPQRPCHICRKVTITETLMNRGGMCQGCYDDYLEHGPSHQGRIGLNNRSRT